MAGMHRVRQFHHACSTPIMALLAMTQASQPCCHGHCHAKLRLSCCVDSAIRDGGDAGEPEEVTGVVPHQAYDDLFTVCGGTGCMAAPSSQC